MGFGGWRLAGRGMIRRSALWGKSLRQKAGQKRARRAGNQIFAESWQGADARRPAGERFIFHNRYKRGGFADGRELCLALVAVPWGFINYRENKTAVREIIINQEL